MALIKCPECQKDISTQAATCPHCGAPVKKPSDRQAERSMIRGDLMAALVLAVLLLFALGLRQVGMAVLQAQATAVVTKELATAADVAATSVASRTPTPPPASPPTRAPIVAPTSAPRVVATIRESVSYKIAEIKDVSTAAAVRLQVRVSVSGSLTRTEMGRISTEIIRGLPAHNAVYLHFYLPDTDVNGPYTAGSAVWAPYGAWERAREATTGDYSNHRLAIESLTGAITNMPTPKPTLAGIPEATRRQVFYELVQAQDRGLGYSEAKDYIADKYGISLAEIGEIVSEGLRKSWPMPSVE